MENSDGPPGQPQQEKVNKGIINITDEQTTSGSKTGQMNEKSIRYNREERLKLLKDRQNEERLKKLEELKEHALQASKLREEQDLRRRKHFEELGKKEDTRRRQAEEKRKALDEERRLNLQSKWENKKPIIAKQSNKPIYAFGSCTPRIIENIDGCLWKSQYNLNTSTNTMLKSTTSAHDLHSQSFEPDRIFCGRRKTDLTPTLPIRRVDYLPRSASSARSGGENSGSYFSMTRLDNNNGLLGTAIRSKSSSQLAGGKLTRTEKLRRAKNSINNYLGSQTPRIPSSMTSSMISTQSSATVQVRPRVLGPRKLRPVSVHVTGINNGNKSPDDKKKSNVMKSKELKDIKKDEAKKSETTKKSETPKIMKNEAEETKEIEKVNQLQIESIETPAEPEPNSSSSPTPPGATLDDPKSRLKTEEDAKAAIAEKRKLAKELQEKELARLEEEKKLEEEKHRLEIEEIERFVNEAKMIENERLRKAIEEQERKELDERRKREEEDQLRLEREREERETARESERIRLEMEERLKREEEERLERKKRVEAIMSRTRKKDNEKNPNAQDDETVDNMKSVSNGVNNTLSASTPTPPPQPPQTTSELNNYNNNIYTDTLIDFEDIIQSTEQSSNELNPLQDLLS